MGKQTYSAVLEDFGRISIKAFNLPEIRDDDALLQVDLVGVCGSDVGMYTGKARRIQEYLPIILGHEIVGHIVEAGVSFCERHKVRVEDRVIVEFAFGCGFCEACLRGNYRLCEKNLHYGSSISCATPPHLWGGYGQYLYLPPTAVIHRIAPSVPNEAAVLATAVLGNTIRWLRQIGGVSIGDRVVIEGPGQQGLAAVITAKESGASQIIVIGLSTDKKRLEIASSLGATHIIDSTKEDPISEIKDITEGEMADIVIDLSGSPKCAIDALEMVRKGGTVILPGTYGTDVQVPISLDKVALNEIRIQGVYSHDVKSVVPAIKLVESGKYPLELIVTHHYPLKQAEKAIRTAGGMVEAESPIKVVIDPTT